MAELIRPFVMHDRASTTEEPLARLRAVRRGRGDWIVRASGAANGVSLGDVDGNNMEGGGRIGHLLAALEWRAVGAALAATARYALIHAAALRRGADTVLLLGKSGAGKTTLTLGLMGRGWEPFADDVALVDAHSLEVRAFPRCFHVDAATMVALPRRPQLKWSGSLPGYYRPVHWAEGASRPTVIFLVSRDPERATSRVPVSQAETAGAMLAATIRNRLSSSELAHVTVLLAAQARGCFELNSMSLTAALDSIEAAVGS